MSVVQHDRSGASTLPSTRLLRRLMITCPETGRPADTGLELSAVPRIGGTRQVLVDCLECGHDHEWQVEDVFAE